MYRNNFNSHDVSYIPESFVMRISVIMDGTSVENVSAILRYIEQNLNESEKYIWIISDQPIITGSIIGEKLSGRATRVGLITTGSVSKEILDEKSYLKELK